MATNHSTVEIGFCQCGCGQKTEMAKATHRKRGWIKGQPMPFLKHHSARWAEDRQAANVAAESGLLFCRACKTAKAPSEFFTRIGTNGVRCRACNATRCRDRKINNPEGSRASLRKANLKANYGLSVERYEAMLRQQGGVCAICGKGETRLNRRGEPKSLCVDHNHATGAVRALLCHKCNNALGCLGESVALFRVAIAYLEQHNKV